MVVENLGKLFPSDLVGHETLGSQVYMKHHISTPLLDVVLSIFIHHSLSVFKSNKVSFEINIVW
jgi:hypothetical protein